MSDTAEILRRTQLKLLGKYLLDTKHPVEERAREDRTEEMELELVRSDLQLALEKSGAGNVEEILSCVQALEGTALNGAVTDTGVSVLTK